MNQFKSIFTLNKTLDSKTGMILVYSQVALLILFWVFVPHVFLPTPSDVLAALSTLWKQGIFQHLIVSFRLNVEAIVWSTAISLGLVYLTTIPFFRPLVSFLSKLRFLSMIGLTFVFGLMFSGAHALKLSLLVFSISVFFITSMMDVINSIEKEQFDLARTLRMKEWEVLWEVIILGQIDKVFDVVRQNAAIGWLMLTMVEGIARSEGGVGAVLLNQSKHFHMDAVMGIQIVILLIGLGQDYLIGLAKNMFCPYAELTTKK